VGAVSRNVATDLEEHVAHFRKRVLQDALTEATATYWRRRADVFEAAAPRPGDFIGAATDEDLDAGRARMAFEAQACRLKARQAIVQEGS
jgi:hypothetical protein